MAEEKFLQDQHQSTMDKRKMQLCCKVYQQIDTIRGSKARQGTQDAINRQTMLVQQPLEPQC